MLIVSREIGSRPLGVILTVRKAVFIWGETAVMVPWRIVPVTVSTMAALVESKVKHTIFKFNGHCLIRAFHKKPIRWKIEVSQNARTGSLRSHAQLCSLA